MPTQHKVLEQIRSDKGKELDSTVAHSIDKCSASRHGEAPLP